MLLSFRKIKKLLLFLRQEGYSEGRILKAVALVLSLNVLFGVLFYLVEHPVQPELTLADSIWWAVVTMTTVGYGDFSAITLPGRFIISYLCMFLGIGLIGYIIGFIAESILSTIARTRRGLMKILDEDHLIICNYPGENKLLEVIKEVRATPIYGKYPVVLVTEDLEELPDSLKKQKVQYVRGCPSDEEILFKANILKAVGVIILADQLNSGISDERSFAVGTIIDLIKKEHNLNFKTVVEIENRKNLKLMNRTDIEGMITNDGITSRMLVQEFMYPGIYDIIQQLLSNLEGSQFFILPTRLVGKKVVDIQMEIIKHPTDIQVIGIIKAGEKILNPSKSLLIESGDQLILLAEKITDFEEIENALLG
jgi:voltage-gated potassium channel